MDKKAYQNIKISLLTENVGQVEGLPRNPRWIKDERYKALKKSIEDAPEFLDARMLLVYPHEGKYVVIAGNMRLKACKELGFKELPCYVFNNDTPVEKLREYAIKDNVEFGNIDWDCLANEWDTKELQDWGVECNFLDKDLLEDPLSGAGDLSDDTYEKPVKNLLECPHCHHIDSASHFKKIEGDIPPESPTDNEEPQADEDIS